MNSAESASLKLMLEERGWTAAPVAAESDLILINTCSVRATAEQRALARIAHYAALKKTCHFTLLVTGCMASRLGTQIKADIILNSHAQFPLILASLEEGNAYRAVPMESAFSFAPLYSERGALSSFVPITHGCNNLCSYCIVPFVRGPEVSRNPAAIIREVQLLADKGVCEITLLGQNVNSYRWDSLDFPDLLAMVAQAAEHTSIRWIRFLAANPADFSPRTLTVMDRYPALCRHLHIPVQSGSSAILKAMNRRYTREQYLELIAAIRQSFPDCSFSTDILVGFPGETDEDFSQTLSLMEEVRFQSAFMYHYNPREGTAAFSMTPRVSDAVKHARLDQVIALQQLHTTRALQARLNTQETVLVERISRKNADQLLCRTEHDSSVVVRASSSLVGSFTVLSINALTGHTLHAKDMG
ncbi:putative tRNA-2-methylthio-N6-dimethylallyladenosine synthase [Pillotina sp. SPG140]|jgi:tRNA-2-methylthio-N6-dimethylallyladenosine synthase